MRSILRLEIIVIAFSVACFSCALAQETPTITAKVEDKNSSIQIGDVPKITVTSLPRLEGKSLAINLKNNGEKTVSFSPGLIYYYVSPEDQIGFSNDRDDLVRPVFVFLSSERDKNPKLRGSSGHGPKGFPIEINPGETKTIRYEIDSSLLDISHRSETAVFALRINSANIYKVSFTFKDGKMQVADQ